MELSTYFYALTIRKQLSETCFERNGIGQEPSRGHKFSILELCYYLPNICRPAPEDYDEILQVWEDSVRHTHHFLTEEHIQFYKPLVRNHYLSAVELYIIRNANGKIVAFMGLSDELIEMLFVSPGEQGKGYGRRLLEYATRRKQMNKVDVNEQNEKALGFYLRMGFRIIGRDETDGIGKPYPILHLQLPEAENGNK